MHPPPVLLQLCPLPPDTEAALRRDYEVLRAPSRSAPAVERAAWLDRHGGSVRAVVTGGHQGLDAALADRLPNLGMIAVFGVGVDRIDLSAMRARGVSVGNTPDALTEDVADLAIALMLNVMRALPAADAHVRRGDWPTRGQPPLGRRASGLRYGIVGLGRIGAAIARRLEGFGGSVSYTGPRRKPAPHRFHERLVELAARSDVLFVATPATEHTRGMVDRAVLDALGPDGVLVNVARGAVVDEPALVAALAEGRLWGAGLDVFDREPEVPDALRAMPNVSLAPHVGSATAESRAAMGRMVLDNLDAFFAGRTLPGRAD